MTTYRLGFDDRALREFQKLDFALQNQAKKKLRERLLNPRVEADHLSRLSDCYKNKLRKLGIRIIYRIDDGKVMVIVIAVGKRDSGKQRDVYDLAVSRLLGQ